MIDKLLEELCKTYRTKHSKIKKHTYKVITPFSLMNSDPITFIVEQTSENSVRLRDNLLLYRYFDMSFYDPSNTALNIMKNILKTFSITEDNYEFSKVINLEKNDYIYEMIDYVNGLIRLSDITFLKRENLKREFYDIVREFIEKEINSKYKYFNQGLIGIDTENNYPIDFSLSNDKNKWVIINAISSPNKINEATINLMYYQHIRQEPVYSISIFDELSSLVKGKKANRLINYTDKIISDLGEESKSIIKKQIERNL